MRPSWTAVKVTFQERKNRLVATHRTVYTVYISPPARRAESGPPGPQKSPPGQQGRKPFLRGAGPQGGPGGVPAAGARPRHAGHRQRKVGWYHAGFRQREAGACGRRKERPARRWGGRGRRGDGRAGNRGGGPFAAPIAEKGRARRPGRPHTAMCVSTPPGWGGRGRRPFAAPGPPEARAAVYPKATCPASVEGVRGQRLPSTYHGGARLAGAKVRPGGRRVRRKGVNPPFPPQGLP